MINSSRWFPAVVVVALTVGCGGHSKGPDERGPRPVPPPSDIVAAPTVFTEPLSKYNHQVLYTACTSYKRYRDGASNFIQSEDLSQFYRAQLVPLDIPISKDDSWMENGKFVGVVENTGPSPWSNWHLSKGSQGQPAVTCVWFGIDKGDHKLKMRLVGEKTFVSFDAQRDAHTDPHLNPKARWNPPTDPDMVSEMGFAPQRVNLRMAKMLSETAWYVCDETGCCKRRS